MKSYEIKVDCVNQKTYWIKVEAEDHIKNWYF